MGIGRKKVPWRPAGRLTAVSQQPIDPGTFPSDRRLRRGCVEACWEARGGLPAAHRRSHRFVRSLLWALCTEGLSIRGPPGRRWPGACRSPLGEAHGMRSPAGRPLRGLPGPLRRGGGPECIPWGLSSKSTPVGASWQLSPAWGAAARPSGASRCRCPCRVLAAASPGALLLAASRLRLAGAGSVALSRAAHRSDWEGCCPWECAWGPLQDRLACRDRLPVPPGGTARTSLVEARASAAGAVAAAGGPLGKRWSLPGRWLAAAGRAMLIGMPG